MGAALSRLTEAIENEVWCWARRHQRSPEAAEATEECRRSSSSDLRSHAFVPHRADADVWRRYKSPRELGEGSYGKVYVAKDKEVPGRRVAIKEIAVPSEEQTTAFLCETSVMKDLDHPNICRLWETYEAGHTMWLVMEFCEGGELFDRIVLSDGIAENDSQKIVEQVASALGHAHSKGIAHRDLKPENCCFSSADVLDNQVKVIDWGIAFYFQQAVMRSDTGSSLYMAPEVHRCRAGATDAYTHGCDVWSLGVMTYVMLCGRPPFSGVPEERLGSMDNELSMSGGAWDTTSNEAKDFIPFLLRADASLRPCMSDVLEHAWLRSCSPRNLDVAVSQQVLSNLQTFKCSSRLYSICAASVARHLDNEKLQEVRDVFTKMDTNRDGMLQLDEVRRGFAEVFGEDKVVLQDIDAMFELLDVDGSGAIDYTEFCAASLDQCAVADRTAARAAFKAFDTVDDDGRLSREELEQALTRFQMNHAWSPEFRAQAIREAFERFDANGDGVLDFAEWLQLIDHLRTPAVTGPEAVAGPTLLGRLAAELPKQAGIEASDGCAGSPARLPH